LWFFGVSGGFHGKAADSIAGSPQVGNNDGVGGMPQYDVVEIILVLEEELSGRLCGSSFTGTVVIGVVKDDISILERPY